MCFINGCVNGMTGGEVVVGFLSSILVGMKDDTESCNQSSDETMFNSAETSCHQQGKRIDGSCLFGMVV